MKSLWVKAAVSSCCIALAQVCLAAGAPATSASGPRIQFTSKEYDFGKVIAGEKVEHDFVFTNGGNATLKITGVYPSCGCTTAGAWSKLVEPGKTGTIPLQFNSSHFAGQSVTKTATVVCNDKSQPSVMLMMKGRVWRPIEVNPQVAVLNVPPEAPTNIQAVVHITSSLPEAITLSQPQSNNREFAADLKTIRAGKEFQLTIHTVPPLKQGTVQGRISIKTSSTNVPLIEVTALAIVQPTVAVMPPQIMLPPGPFSHPYAYTVSVRNNSSRPMTISDAAVSTNDVSLQLREVQTGRQFMATVTFPAGFQIPRGQEVDITMKTSLPEVPEVKVPVRQAMRPRPRVWRPPVLHRGPVPPPVVPASRPAGGS